MIDIVIVNWNSGAQLKECLDSVLEYREDQVGKIIVVDNGSIDGSVDGVDELTGVSVIRAGKNLGFASACNIGARKCDSSYILFLNPDTRVESNSFSVPLAFMEQPENRNVGVCSIQLYDERGAVSCSCSRFPTFGRLVASALGVDKLPGLGRAGMFMQDWDHQDSMRVDQVIGAFYLIRRNAFEKVHGFDERFFVYFEEVDLSLRLKQAGLVSWYLANARAFHAGGGASRQIKARRLFYSLRSRLQYSFKNFPRWQAWSIVGITGGVEPWTRTFWCLIHYDLVGIKNTWEAYWMLVKDIKRILKNR